MPINDEKKLVSRAPVVVVMGHIDHGKSTLLDYIRKSNIVASEAGGITQHVGAYQVEHVRDDGTKAPITFLDTPGHEAFGGIRERGAKAADIAILVVSAEDGVKPQTMDAFRVIKEQNVPYIVAISKIDKPNADLNKAKQSLGEHEIYLEGWGGDVPNVAISAITGAGVPELLDMILLVSDMADLKAAPDEPATGIVIESELDHKRGIQATLLVKNGSFKTGDYIVAGGTMSPVRYIENFKGEKVELAGPSMPVQIIGWNEVPQVGSTFVSLTERKKAETLANQQKSILANQKAKPEPVPEAAKSSVLPTGHGNQPKHVESDIVVFPIIIKADVIGSLEGIKYELAKIKHEKVHVKVVSEGIGEINEKDVKTAQTDSNIVVIGFHTKPDKKAASMVERNPVNVQLFTVIYELVQYIKDQVQSKIPKEYMEETLGIARILATFSHEKDRQVIGGKVESGKLESGNDVKIIRRSAEIGRGKIRELQTKKSRVDEVAEGHEFGVLVEAKMEIAVGDRLEAVRTVEKHN